jgi:hypothetical protein
MMAPFIRIPRPPNIEKEIAMLGRIAVATLLVSGAVTASNTAFAQSDAAVAAGVVTGLAVGTAIAMEHRAPLHEYIYSEPRPSYVYEDEVVVGRPLRPGGYQSYPVPERYGAQGYHYTVVNNRAVVYHPQTRTVVHVYDRR